jgi:hypothetical protein
MVAAGHLLRKLADGANAAAQELVAKVETVQAEEALLS